MQAVTTTKMANRKPYAQQTRNTSATLLG